MSGQPQAPQAPQPPQIIRGIVKQVRLLDCWLGLFFNEPSDLGHVW